jgi:hypothetical protein
MSLLHTLDTYGRDDDSSESRTVFSHDYHVSEYVSKDSPYRSTRINLFVDNAEAYEIYDRKQDDGRVIRTLVFKAPDGGRLEVSLFELPTTEEK